MEIESCNCRPRPILPAVSQFLVLFNFFRHSFNLTRIMYIQLRGEYHRNGALQKCKLSAHSWRAAAGVTTWVFSVFPFSLYISNLILLARVCRCTENKRIIFFVVPIKIKTELNSSSRGNTENNQNKKCDNIQENRAERYFIPTEQNG